MWSMNFRAWRPEMRKQVDALVRQDDTVMEDKGWKDPRKLYHSRIQGNPLYDAAAIYWHDDVGYIRRSNEMYDLKGIQDYMDVLGNAILRSESPALIDVDDPEFVEFGEDRMSERLTSMLADVLKGREAWPEGQEEMWTIVTKYMENMMFHTMEQGWARQGAAFEVLRQQLGFTYEWSGAEID